MVGNTCFHCSCLDMLFFVNILLSVLLFLIVIISDQCQSNSSSFFLFIEKNVLLGILEQRGNNTECYVKLEYNLLKYKYKSLPQKLQAFSIFFFRLTSYSHSLDNSDFTCLIQMQLWVIRQSL